MKRLFLCLLFSSSIIAYPQNQVIGNADNLLAHGNLIVSKPFKKTAANPTASQTKSMINGATVEFASTDSIGRLFDPGGLIGNYARNQLAYANINYSSQSAFEVILEDVDLRSGDSLIINSRDAFGPTTNTLLAIGNGYSTRGSFEFDNIDGSYYLEIIFKSNPDAVVGRGFSLLFRRLFPYVPPVLVDYPSLALLYNSALGAVRSGYTGPEPMGFYSSAFGEGNIVEGQAAHAAGKDNTASGSYSSAIGFNNRSQGYASITAGYMNQAAGTGAAAVGGYRSYARGNYAFSTGYDCYSHADYAFSTGNTTAATGNSAPTFGEGTLSESYVCMSLGRYNYTTPTSSTEWITTDPVLIVGNGTDGNHRSNILEFYKNGNLGIYGNFYHFSDQRLKRDFKKLTHSLDKLDSLKGYNYYWKSKDVDNKLQTGMIAQEVQKVFPELVTTNLKGEYAVNYEGLIPHLVEAIKELKEEIDELKKKQQTDMTVFLSDDKIKDRIAVQPNPINDQLTITINTTNEGIGSVILYDNSGKLVKKMGITVSNGNNIIRMSIPPIAAGNYKLVADWGKDNLKQVNIIKQ